MIAATSIEQAREDFANAHVLYKELLRGNSKAMNGMVAVAPRIRDFIATALGRTGLDVNEQAIDLIADERKAKRFLHELCKHNAT